jgi:hypothetical protein
MNDKDIGLAPVTSGTQLCSDLTYNGAYFYSDGGYVKQGML